MSPAAVSRRLLDAAPEPAPSSHTWSVHPQILPLYCRARPQVPSACVIVDSWSTDHGRLFPGHFGGTADAPSTSAQALTRLP